MKKLFNIMLVMSLAFLPSATQAISSKDRRAVLYDTAFFDKTDTINTLGTAPIGEEEIIKHVAFTGPSITVKGVVLHWTGGNPNATVEEFVSAIKSNKSCGEQGCSVQFYVDGSGNVYQLVDQINTFTAHAGPANGCCVGIEIAGRGESDLLSNAVQKQAVVSLVAYLAQKYSIPLSSNVSGLTGILSHHQIAPDRKIDVGDNYLEQIMSALSTPSSSGTISGEDPATLPPRVRPVNFNLSPNVSLGQTLAATKNWGSGNEFRCLYELWLRESTWNEDAQNPKSTAYGIPQFLDQTWGAYGFKKTSDPKGQIEAGLVYIEKRYGSPCNAILFHNRSNWY